MIKAIAENASYPEKNYTASGNEYLNKARIELNTLMKVQMKCSGDFSSDWKALRCEYIILNNIFI